MTRRAPLFEEPDEPEALRDEPDDEPEALRALLLPRPFDALLLELLVRPLPLFPLLELLFPPLALIPLRPLLPVPPLLRFGMSILR